MSCTEEGMPAGTPNTPNSNKPVCLQTHSTHSALIIPQRWDVYNFSHACGGVTAPVVISSEQGGTFGEVFSIMCLGRGDYISFTNGT